jgi:uncharacterized protein YkwD
MVMGRRRDDLARGKMPCSRFVRLQMCGFALLTVIVATVSVIGSGERPGAANGPLRMVRSSLTPGKHALRLTTSPLYAPNDPWSAYLANESACPGGERTDLPVDRQVATVVCLVNYARGRRGLRPLGVRATLNGASATKARAIIRCQNFAHNPCGGDWAAAVRSTGYVGMVGENLYVATGRSGAPRAAVDAWLNSRAHRENLFKPEWQGQGLAVLRKERFAGYRDVALWVNVLGDR